MNTLIKKFNQGKVIKDLKNTYEIDETNMNIINEIRDGMCYMLSIEWLMQLLDNNALPPENVFPDMFYYEIGDEKYHYTPEALAYFMQIAGNFYKYSADLDLTGSCKSSHPGAEIITNLNFSDIDKRYIELCSKDKHTVIDYDCIIVAPNDLIPIEYINIISNMISKNKGILLEIYVNEKATKKGYKTKFAHAMAIWQGENKYYFFDTNFGIYESDDLTDFLDETEAAYEDIYRRNYKKDIRELDSIEFTFSVVM